MSQTASLRTHLQHQQSKEMWAADLETAHLKPHHWRKSSQWSTILREHAQVSCAAMHTCRRIALSLRQVFAV